MNIEAPPEKESYPAWTPYAVVTMLLWFPYAFIVVTPGQILPSLIQAAFIVLFGGCVATVSRWLTGRWRVAYVISVVVMACIQVWSHSLRR
jgi:hypothetical protein